MGSCLLGKIVQQLRPWGWRVYTNKANLRDLIAATGLVILLKLFFFCLYDLEIRWMNSKNNRAHPLCYIKVRPLFQSHQWIQTGVTVWECSIVVKFAIICPVWPWNLTDGLDNQYRILSMLLQALCIILWPLNKLNLSYSPETLNSGENLWFYLSHVTLKFNRWLWKTIILMIYCKITN